MKDLHIVIKFLSNLGLSNEEAQLYITLVQKSGMTVLQASRYTKISRTSVYRYIENLKAAGLVEEVLEGTKRIMYPVGIHKLELLVRDQETKADQLRTLLPELSSILTAHESLSQPGTKVLMYKGVEGIKQMVWNTLKAEGECIGYSLGPLSDAVGLEFEKKWRVEFALRGLKFRDIVNEDYEEKYGNNLFNNDSSRFKTKVVSKDVLEISHQVDIYNDVVAYYGWYEDEVFGVEMYNERIAKQQKQMFQLVWMNDQ